MKFEVKGKELTIPDEFIPKDSYFDNLKNFGKTGVDKTYKIDELLTYDELDTVKEYLINKKLPHYSYFDALNKIIPDGYFSSFHNEIQYKTFSSDDPYYGLVKNNDFTIHKEEITDLVKGASYLFTDYNLQHDFHLSEEFKMFSYRTTLKFLFVGPSILSRRLKVIDIYFYSSSNSSEELKEEIKKIIKVKIFKYVLYKNYLEIYSNDTIYRVFFKMYKSPADILYSQSVDSMGVCYDGEDIYFTERALHAYRTRRNVVNINIIEETDSVKYTRDLVFCGINGIRSYGNFPAGSEYKIITRGADTHLESYSIKRNLLAIVKDFRDNDYLFSGSKTLTNCNNFLKGGASRLNQRINALNEGNLTYICSSYMFFIWLTDSYYEEERNVENFQNPSILGIYLDKEIDYHIYGRVIIKSKYNIKIEGDIYEGNKIYNSSSISYLLSSNVYSEKKYKYLCPMILNINEIVKGDMEVILDVVKPILINKDRITTYYDLNLIF